MIIRLFVAVAVRHTSLTAPFGCLKHDITRESCCDAAMHFCRYVACMNPTAGSFVVNPRLQRLFMTLAVEFPGQESLMKIYGTFVTGHLKKFSADVQVC